MTYRERVILRYMKPGEEYTTSDVSAALSIPSRKCCVVMGRMINKGYVEIAKERNKRSHRTYRKIAQ